MKATFGISDDNKYFPSELREMIVNLDGLHTAKEMESDPTKVIEWEKQIAELEQKIESAYSVKDFTYMLVSDLEYVDDNPISAGHQNKVQNNIMSVPSIAASIKQDAQDLGNAIIAFSNTADPEQDRKITELSLKMKTDYTRDMLIRYIVDNTEY